MISYHIVTRGFGFDQAHLGHFLSPNEPRLNRSSFMFFTGLFYHSCTIDIHVKRRLSLPAWHRRLGALLCQMILMNIYIDLIIIS